LFTKVLVVTKKVITQIKLVSKGLIVFYRF